jgi:hypothetical protein
MELLKAQIKEFKSVGDSSQGEERVYGEFVSPVSWLTG